MPNPITEVDEYTAGPVVAPDGDDWMDDAAEVVELVAQVLANRTHWLKGYVDRAVLNDDETRSVLTVPLQVDTTRVRDPLLRSLKGPHDQSGYSTSALPWKELVRAKNVSAADNQRSSMYIGDGVQGLFGFAVNAQWREDLSTGRWKQLDTGKASYFLYINAAGDLRMSKKAAGSADWASWDTTTDCAIGAPTVNAGFLHADTIQGDTFVLGAQVVAQTSFAYQGVQERTTPIKLTDFIGFSWLKTTGYLYFQDDITSDKNELCASIRVPVGATITAIRVRHAQSTSTGDRFSVMKRVNLTVGTIAVTEEFHADANSTVSSDKVTTISPIGYEVADGDEVYFRWKLVDVGDPSSLAGNHVLGVEVDWQEVNLSYQ
jgi:hypothetical protein